MENLEKLVLRDHSISEIKELIDNKRLDIDLFLELAKKDNRSGVKNIVKKILNERKKIEKLYNKYKKMNSFEEKFYEKGVKLIAGIDEVGRGPLAGPVVSAAVILDKNIKILGLDDSKKLSEEKREKLFNEIVEKALCYSYSFMGISLIDEINILNATKVSMVESVKSLDIKPELLFIDAINIDYDIKQISIIHGDAISNSIAAASIVAKVIRDRYMKKIHKEYPVYNFLSNKGYGTKEHIEAIKKHGICKYHRKTFVKNFI